MVEGRDYPGQGLSRRGRPWFSELGSDLAAEDEEILRKPSPIPDKAITGVLIMDESNPGKLFDPVGARLFIEVPDAALAGMGGGHDDVIGVVGQGYEERIGEVGVDVFRYFEAPNEIEPSTKVEGDIEVATLDFFRVYSVADGGLGSFHA